MTTPTRREFLRAAGVLAASSALVSPSTAFAANDTIRVGCIGVGGRCRKLMESLRTIPGVGSISTATVLASKAASSAAASP